MQQAELVTQMRPLYPGIQMRGRQITRLEESHIGWFELDAMKAVELGIDQVGAFVADCGALCRLVKHLGYLDSAGCTGWWLVLPSTKEFAAALHFEWSANMAGTVDGVIKAPVGWRSRNVWLATIEDLRKIRAEMMWRADKLAGIILIDSECMVYRARGNDAFGRYLGHDRPQEVADFRGSLSRNSWCPPLFLWTTKRAKEVPTAYVAKAFCLNAFIFVDGTTYSCRARSASEVAQIQRKPDGGQQSYIPLKPR